MKFIPAAARRPIFIRAVLVCAAVLCAVTAGCGSTGNGRARTDSDSQDDETPREFTGSFAGYEWTVPGGTVFVVGNRLVVENPAEGIALMLAPEAAAAAAQQFGDRFYAEAVVRPTAKGSGKNKNFGVACRIGKTASGEENFYYAGVNWNGRNQLGTALTPKGLQFGSLVSDTSVWSAVCSDQPYVIRCEYDGGTISGSFNGIPFNKSGKTSYTIKDGETISAGSFGIYTNGDSFELYSFKIGSLDTGRAALKLSSMNGDFITLKEDSTPFVLLNENNWNVRTGTDAAEFRVEAFDDAGTACDFSVSADGAAVRVERTETGFTMTPVAVGSAAVTVSNAADSSVRKLFRCTVSKGLTLTDTDYGSYAAFYPQPGTAGVYEDDVLSITFDGPPVLVEDAVYLYDAASGALVDTIRIGSETVEIPDGTGKTTSYLLKDFMVQIDGNTVYVKPHYGALENGGSYYVVIPDGAICGTVNGKPFTGFDREQKRWAFTTRAAYVPVNAAALKVGTSVAADYRTLQAALNAAADGAVVSLEAGTHREIICYKGGKNVTVAGPAGNARGAGCEIVGINCNAYNGGTHGRAAFYWSGSDLTLKNLTIRNAYDRNIGGTAQSEALFFANGAGKKLAAYNCSFKGFQDTIQTTGKNWFYDCHIEGDTDFIWGYADVALFEKCDIVMLDTSKDAVPASASYVFETRVGSLSSALVPKGYVLLNCTVQAAHGGGNWFGRRATAKDADTDYYDQAAVVNTTVTGTVQAPLWSVGNEPEYRAPDAAGNMNVGWKTYGGSGFRAPAGVPYAGTISDAVYAAEYGNRNLIMNRVFNTDTGAYGPSDSLWNLDPAIFE